MKSRWFEQKEQAIALRKQGISIREIEKLLSIPRSTLSGWFNNIELTPSQSLKLQQDWTAGLIKARIKASKWHHAQKELRLQQAQIEATVTLNEIVIDNNVIELALAMLYMGEGAKSNTTAMGNSNPLVLKFFLTVLMDKYKVPKEKIRCELHLRADQNPEKMKKYWSEELKLPLSNFRSTVFDMRTKGRKTYPTYKGVCILYCGNIAIQRKLTSLYGLFCQRVIDQRAVSSIG